MCYTGNGVFDPNYSNKDTVWGNSYHHCLNKYVRSETQIVLHNSIFQQSGVPSHISRDMHITCDTLFVHSGLKGMAHIIGPEDLLIYASRFLLMNVSK